MFHMFCVHAESASAALPALKLVQQALCGSVWLFSRAMFWSREPVSGFTRSNTVNLKVNLNKNLLGISVDTQKVLEPGGEKGRNGVFEKVSVDWQCFIPALQRLGDGAERWSWRWVRCRAPLHFWNFGVLALPLWVGWRQEWETVCLNYISAEAERVKLSSFFVKVTWKSRGCRYWNSWFISFCSELKAVEIGGLGSVKKKVHKLFMSSFF